MTTTIESVSGLSISTEERATRLNEAGEFWSTRIANDVAAASLVYKVSGDARGSVASEITAGKHTFFVDEPAALAGDDLAASPVEFALGAFIACQIVVYRLYAHNLGIVIDDISADAEGDLDVRGLFSIDPAIRPGFSAIRLNVKITGPETHERYEELRKIVDAHCPVLDLFANVTPVEVTITTK